jgi:hypothetical protein
MFCYRLPDCDDIAPAKQRACLAVLRVALYAAQQALYVEHRWLLDKHAAKSTSSKFSSLVSKIVDRCDKMIRLIDTYDKLIEDELNAFRERDDFPF